MKIALLLATGYEEGESLFVADILRRAGFEVDLVSTTKEIWVTGAHGIKVEADRLLDKSVYHYDMVILPGGMPGAVHLRDDQRVIDLIRFFDKEHKYIGAICAAPIVLHAAGILNGRKMTSYPGEKYESLFSEAQYCQETVVIDDRLITSRGPATTLPFAYAIVDLLGGDSKTLKQGMLYLDIEKQG